MKLRNLLSIIVLFDLTANSAMASSLGVGSDAQSAVAGESPRERVNFDKGWFFAYGNAADPAKDYGCGTEYFNYLTKANSIHNEGPYALKFVQGEEWKAVDLPHDWVVDLPYSEEASFSHGHKTVGWKYPETSVGWYRKTFTLSEEDKGKHIRLIFDGIFRDARIWVNGFYIGGEQSGYKQQDYDITDYLLFGPDQQNLVCVRCDATLEEGWFYEGGGIYRHVWLQKTETLHVVTNGTFVHSKLTDNYTKAQVTIETEVCNDSNSPSAAYRVEHSIIAPDGTCVATATAEGRALEGREKDLTIAECELSDPLLWDVEQPNLYKIVTQVIADDGNVGAVAGGDVTGGVVDEYVTRTGFREIVLDKDKGFFLNGKHLKLKGFNMHQDHPGVGVGIPDGLQYYRLERLKWMGANAYRASHNPMTPEMLDACDELGILVFEETRLTGINDYQISLLTSMIRRDRNHPSVFLWGVGNEEWGIEWDDRGDVIAATMQEYAHRADPTRPACAASSSGPTILRSLDVAGYNYIVQHHIDEDRARYPERIALGSEETTGCGTRGEYFPGNGTLRQPAHYLDSAYRAEKGLPMEFGWQFYNDRPWLLGLFYWTGFDYRGESNPLVYPVSGSLFGVLDYCGFPKDEAYYLRSWWTDEPVLHVFPHWNLQGHEGESVRLWVYSNCDEVELIVNGRRLGRKTMPENGHLEWEAVYKPGYVQAVGYKNGRVCMKTRVETTGEPTSVSSEVLRYDDICVVNISVLDKKGRVVPTACIPLEISVGPDVRILGYGNGDSGFLETERPTDPDAKSFSIKTFNGCAQVILQTEAATPAFEITMY